jgi:hypothetical protein
MVGVNADGRVKVWVSHHYNINGKTDIDQQKLLGSEE